MKRVLLISSGGLEKGGVQSVLMAIVRSLYKEIVFDIVLLTNKNGYYEEEFESYGGRVYRIDKRLTNKRIDNLLSYMVFPVELKNFIEKLCNKNDYCAVHFNCGIAAGPSLRTCNRLGVRNRIVHIHGVSETISIGIKGLIRFIFYRIYLEELRKYSSNRIACSKKAGMSFFDSTSFEVIYNPIEEEFYTKKSTKNDLGIRLIQVGYFTDNKNQLFSLEIIKEIRKAYPEVYLTFIGFDVEGYLARMIQYIEENNLFRNVIILPAETCVKTELDKSDYMLFPSLSEGFGIALVEAQCRGVFCFASDSVPKETDCGGVEYLNLDKGACYWAEKIMQKHINRCNSRENYNCEEFRYSSFKRRIRKLYCE